MGAGAVKEAGYSEDQTVLQESEVMSSCELCSVNFTLLKRKKLCSDCGKIYCSNCMSKQTIGRVTQRRCKHCQLLTSGNFTRGDLMALSTKDLRSFIMRRRIPMNNCREKADLVDLLLSTSNNSYYKREQAARHQHLIELEERRRQREAESGHWGSVESGHNAVPAMQQNSSNITSESQPTSLVPPTESASSDPSEELQQSQTVESSSVTVQLESVDNEPVLMEQESNLDNENTSTNPNSSSPDGDPVNNTKKLTRLKDMKDIKDIEALNVRQLKELLATNYVVYKGCCEKWELVERVKRLWIDRQKNIDKVNELEKVSEVSTANDESELCKICMDAVIDCVLLDCGHMVACTQCGKQMAECPMCRQYVVRVVHVFKA